MIKATMLKTKIVNALRLSRWGVGASFIATAWWLGLTGVSNASNGILNNTASDELSALASLYQDECSACHLAYPPKLLPAGSWKIIMTQLDNHYGENAEISQNLNDQISQYLNQKAGTVGRGFLKRVQDSDPLRITQLPFFLRKHNEIPDRLVAGNPKVGSFSNCNVCHKGAAKGDFDEDTVNIPGYGRWDD